MDSFTSILVVDDDAAVRSFLSRFLIYHGYQIMAVDSGEAALEVLRTRKFDLALIDLKMPGIDGLEVLAALRQRSPDTAAIILTAHGSLDSAAEALRQGASDYLLKPCKVENLHLSVHAGLKKHRQILAQRAKAQLVYEISRELRNPLTDIDLNIHLLEHGKQEKQNRYLENLRLATDRIRQMIENTLALSEMDTEETLETLTRENLNWLVDQVLSTYTPQAEAAGLELEFTPGSDLPLVMGARAQLIQLITNLLSNALYYTPAGKIHISTAFIPSREQVCLTIQDTGIGISALEFPHLFERFYRGPRAAQLRTYGIGLGLAIVKRIIELHRGQIEVESREDEGSTFRIWLPILKIPDPLFSEKEDEATETEENGNRRGNATLVNIKEVPG